MTDECVATKNNGEPCENPVKYADGKCGVHTDATDTSPGQPTKFNKDRAQAAIWAAREGKSKRGCERAAGVSDGTINNWIEQGQTFEDEDGHIVQFFRGFAQARASGESKLIRRGFEDPDADGSFIRFMLASSYDYVKTEKQETELTGEGGGPLEVSFNEEVVTTPWSSEQPDADADGDEQE